MTVFITGFVCLVVGYHVGRIVANVRNLDATKELSRMTVRLLLADEAERAQQLHRKVMDM